jgi:hypothetical protein
MTNGRCRTRFDAKLFNKCVAGMRCDPGLVAIFDSGWGLNYSSAGLR